MKPSRLNVAFSFRGVFRENVTESIRDDDYRKAGIVHATSIRYRELHKYANLLSANWHNATQTPYVWNPKNQTLLTFENKRSLEEKVKYVIERNIGGITINSIEDDDDLNTLLNVITATNKCSGPKNKIDEIKFECDDVKT